MRNSKLILCRCNALIIVGGKTNLIREIFQITEDARREKERIADFLTVNHSLSLSNLNTCKSRVIISSTIFISLFRNREKEEEEKTEAISIVRKTEELNNELFSQKNISFSPQSYERSSQNHEEVMIKSNLAFV